MSAVKYLASVCRRVGVQFDENNHLDLIQKAAEFIEQQFEYKDVIEGTAPDPNVKVVAPKTRAKK